MRKLAFVVASAATIAGISVAAARGPYGSIHVGNWNGGAYTNDASGEFSGCTAGATYHNGIYFAVSVSSNVTWSLGFAHPSWQLTPNQAFPIDLVNMIFTSSEIRFRTNSLWSPCLTTRHSSGRLENREL